MRPYFLILFISFLFLLSCKRSQQKSNLVLTDYFPQKFNDDSLQTLLTILVEPPLYKEQDTSSNIFRLIFFSKNNWLHSKVIRIEKYGHDSTITIYPNVPDSTGGFGGLELKLPATYWDSLQSLLNNYNFENQPFNSTFCNDGIYDTDFYIMEESKQGIYYLIKREVPISNECEEDQKLLSIVNFIDSQIQITH